MFDKIFLLSFFLRTSHSSTPFGFSLNFIVKFFASYFSTQPLTPTPLQQIQTKNKINKRVKLTKKIKVAEDFPKKKKKTTVSGLSYRHNITIKK